jgi:hypothetical protein
MTAFAVSRILIAVVFVVYCPAASASRVLAAFSM